MPHLAIKIVGKDDTFEFDDMAPTYKTGQLRGAAVLEAGMKSGRSSIMFHVKLETGESVIVETSAAIIEMLNSVTKGANMRFNDNK